MNINEDILRASVSILSIAKLLYDHGKLNRLFDYIGLPPEIVENGNANLKVSVLPFLAYQRIWNDYFRDENLQDDLFKKDDGKLWKISQMSGRIPLVTDMLDLFQLRKKAWEKDYFTSALPEPQLGDPVPVPISGTVTANDGVINFTDLGINGPLEVSGTQKPLIGRLLPGQTLPSGGSAVELYNEGESDSIGQFGRFGLVGNNTGLAEISGSGKGSVSSVSGFSVSDASFTINDLRLASSIQRFNELLARAGHRYKETILSMFNQVTPDYRLDRPEFICSCNIPISISEVPQTSATEQGSTPQATLAGNAIAYNNSGMYRYHCQEHGFIITLICAIPRTKYVNGINRMFTREDRYDYYTPVFENLGEQAIKNREVYVSGTDSDDEDWGYAPRYSEYKYIPSTVHGEFRSSLDFMTLARIFDSLPTLSGDFITPDDETCNRGFAVTDNSVQHLYIQVINHLFARRPMQKLPIPKLV